MISLVLKTSINSLTQQGDILQSNIGEEVGLLTMHTASGRAESNATVLRRQPEELDCKAFNKMFNSLPTQIPKNPNKDILYNVTTTDESEFNYHECI